jgi:hypothetical protein
MISYFTLPSVAVMADVLHCEMGSHELFFLVGLQLRLSQPPSLPGSSDYVLATSTQLWSTLITLILK